MRSTGGNSVLPQLAVTCKIEAECSYQTLVQFDSKMLPCLPAGREIANFGNTQNVIANLKKRHDNCHTLKF